MKKLAAITLTSMMLLLATAMVVGAVDKVEIRGDVKDVVDASAPSWDPQTFAGFFYDIDDNLGNEKIEMAIANGKLEEPNGVKYTTSTQENDFDFADWGWYNSIGFLGENYFAGYSEKKPVVNGAEIDAQLYKESTDRNMLIDEQLLKVLKDDDTEMTVTTGTPLKMEEGYELAIKSIDIDGNKVYLELSKDGAVVDSKVISPSKDAATMGDKTYYYKKDIGDTKDIVIIAAHFKNAFRGADQNLATVDSVWQVSDTPASVEVDTEYDKMRIASVTADTITMDNKDNSITLSKNKDSTLMAGIGIKTADQDEITADNPLRFYIYKSATIEGAAAPAAEAVAANVTAEAAPVVEAPAAEAAPAAEENKTVEAPAAEAAPAAENKSAEAAPAGETKAQPGFEGVFALTGLLAVAYLVLGRRE